MNQVRGVIFDLDGTLLNTLASLANSHNRMLTQLGYPTHDVDAYRYFIGDGARKCIVRCLPVHARSDEIIDRALEIQRADYRLNWHQDVEIYSGMEKVLHHLKSAGFAIAVLSNKDQNFTEQCINHFFPTAGFDEIVGHSISIAHKPDPTGARTIACSVGIRTEEMALVGDTAMDIETALACNMIAVGVLWGFREKQELVDAGACYLVSHSSELLALLK